MELLDEIRSQAGQALHVSVPDWLDTNPPRDEVSSAMSALTQASADLDKALLMLGRHHALELTRPAR